MGEAKLFGDLAKSEEVVEKHEWFLSVYLHSRDIEGLSDTSFWRQRQNRTVESLEFVIFGLVLKFLLC